MMRVSKAVVASFAALLLGLGLLASSPAQAADVTSTKCADTGRNSGGNPGGEDIFACTGLVEGDTIVMQVDQVSGTGATETILKATATITVLDISNGSVTLGVVVENDLTTEARITSFGLGIEPDATAGTVTDTSNTDVDELTGFETGNFPGFTLVEFCATSGNTCAGGGADGIDPGNEDAFNFNLTNGFVEGGSIDLSEFGFKFQGGNGGASFEKPGSPLAGSPVAGQPVAGQPVAGQPVAGQVPQPGSLMLMGAALLSGLAATAGLRRFRRSGK